MSGVLAAVSGNGAGGGGGGSSFSANLTSSSSTVEIAFDPKSGTSITSTARGFGLGEAVYGSFGSLSSSAWAGFPIIAIYQADGSGTTVLEVSGDATALSPVLTVGGADQHLGSGSLSGGITTFTGTATDPFTGTKAVTITS